MNCPWCGKEMLPGKLRCFKGSPQWECTDREYSRSERFFGDHHKLIRSGKNTGWGVSILENAYYCPKCKKIIFDGWLE